MIQEIFARIFLSIDSFNENKGDFKFWLRRVTINQCIKHYHSQKQSTYIDPLEAATNIGADVNEKEGGMSEKDMLLFLAGMPEGYKQVFMLVVIDEYSHREVGEMLKISAETSRSQLHRAKKWILENRSMIDLTSLTYEA